MNFKVKSQQYDSNESLRWKNVNLVMQTLVAMTEMTNKISHEGPCASLNVETMQYDRFLVISLVTSSQKQETKYSAKEAVEWGTLSWVSPLIDAFGQASSYMSHLFSFFEHSILNTTTSESKFSSFHIILTQ